jgi:hypothetical protein
MWRSEQYVINLKGSNDKDASKNDYMKNYN